MMVWSFALRFLTVFLCLGVPSSLLADDLAETPQAQSSSPTLPETGEQEAPPNHEVSPQTLAAPTTEGEATKPVPTPTAEPSGPTLNDVSTNSEDPSAVLVEWFGFLVGGGHPYLMVRMVFFKLAWEHGYFTILDTALAYSLGDMGAGFAAGWRKQLPDQYEIRVGLGLRYGWWIVNTSPWIESVNKNYPCIPSDSGDNMMGLVLEPQFAFLKREKSAFVGIHVGLPMMVFGKTDEFYPHYYSTSNQWSPGIQAGLYTSFY